MPNKILSVIVVNYQTERHLLDCLFSVQSQIGEFAEIIVVNNDEKDITPLLSAFPEVKIIKKNNAGFGTGANAGFGQSNGDIILLLNPDAKIATANFGEIAKEFKNDPRLAIIGPALICQGGIQPWSAGIEARLFDLVLNNLNFPRSRTIWKQKKKTLADWVSGTAMFVRRETFEALGGFDGKFFMYFEDMDLCKRARMSGEKVMYFPDFRVEHLGGKSYLESDKQKKDYYDSMEYYFKKHRSFFEWKLVSLIRKIFF